MKVTRIDKTWRYDDGVATEVPMRVVVELTTPEAMKIANGGTLDPMELYEGPRNGDNRLMTYHVGTLEVKREV